MFELLFAGIFAAIVGLNMWSAWQAYGRLPTFDLYRRRHPELFGHGRCQCRCCGGDRIYVHSLDALRRRHVCANCGVLLYRS